MQNRHLVPLVGTIRTLKTKIIALFRGTHHRPLLFKQVLVFGSSDINLWRTSHSRIRKVTRKKVLVLPLKPIYSEMCAGVRVFKAHKVVSDVSVTVQSEYF
jgi:hypothetical protein